MVTTTRMLELRFLPRLPRWTIGPLAAGICLAPALTALAFVESNILTREAYVLSMALTYLVLGIACWVIAFFPKRVQH